MNKSISKMITDKWKNIILEYERVKKKKSKLFTSVNKLCEVHNISRKQLHKYHRRWLESGGKEESLLPNTRGPKKGQYRILSKDQERAITKIQRRFEAKPLDVWVMITGVWKVTPSVRTIARILKRYPLNKKKEIIHRYEKNIPGELVHADTFNIPTNMFSDKKARYLSGIIDDCTRLNYVETIERKASLEVSKTMMHAGKWFNDHGIDIEKLMSDNGSEYTAVHSKKDARARHPFETTLSMIEIKHIYTRPYTPKTNGKIERFWKILREEFLPGLSNLTLEEFNGKLKNFMFYYNYKRSHGGILYKTPFQKLKSVTETLV